MNDLWNLAILYGMDAYILRMERRLLLTLGASSLVSLGLFAGRVLSTDKWDFAFMAWNLALAWMPVFFGWWLVNRLRIHRWLSPANIVLTVLWLLFLPNAFYMVSDLIHLQVTDRISILYDVVMLVSFIWNGFVLGFLSIYGIHQALRRRMGPFEAVGVIGMVFLLCSFAIYLGRYLRWNSWDLLVNPAGLVFDVSDRIINPGAHPQTFTTTLMFFVLLTSIYAVAYELIAILKNPAQKKP